MNIIAGFRNEPHITSQQWRDENIASFGSGVYVLNVGSQMAATVITANEVEIADGMVMAEGCTAEIERGTSESIAIDNGEQGMLRKDLIVVRYTKNASTNVEDMELDIIKGTAASANPSRPSYTSGSIADGDTTVEFPLYEVNISGITITSVTLLATKVELSKKSAVDALTATVNNLVTKIGTVAMGTTATTITGAIKELKTGLTTLTTNLSSAVSRIGTLEGKTQGIEGTRQYTANANSSVYVNLEASSVYLIIVSAWTTGTTMTGMYVVGATTGAALGIKTISAASSVALSDTGNNGILKIENNGNVTLRVSVITLSGSIPL